MLTSRPLPIPISSQAGQASGSGPLKDRNLGDSVNQTQQRANCLVFQECLSAHRFGEEKAGGGGVEGRELNTGEGEWLNKMVQVFRRWGTNLLG